MFRHFPILLFLFLAPGCKQVATTLIQKSISPEVVAASQLPGAWFSYDASEAPGFCLNTERALVWREPGMNLGFWRGVRARDPQRVVMEARGDTFILHRRFNWDGMTVGRTNLRDLYPTVRHDALYYALKEGATFSRREADRAFLRDMRRAGVWGAGFDYALIRAFGGFFLKREGPKSMIVYPLQPTDPPAPLEAPTDKERAADNPVPEGSRGVAPVAS